MIQLGQKRIQQIIQREQREHFGAVLIELEDYLELESLNEEDISKLVAGLKKEYRRVEYSGINDDYSLGYYGKNMDRILFIEW
jgi:hypothetical protein